MFTLTVTTGSAVSLGFVQVNYAVPQSAQTKVTVTYAQAQTAGNLNVAVVGWNNATTQISSVTDTNGNAYALAVGPTVESGTATQAIYYAKNITAAAANGNAVTVTFNTGATNPDVRIAEYSGIDPTNPLDAAVGTQGSGTPSNSGSATTTSPNDILVGANFVQQATTGPGTGYTSRVITTPDGDILEDQIVSASGSHSATAAVNGGGWIMQMVAFRAANGTGSGTEGSSTGTLPTITSATNTTFTVGAAGAFTVTTAGTPAPSLTEAGALPTGVTLKDNGNGTATLGGTPVSGTGGTYSITISASNGIGTAASQGFTLTVSLAPAITSANTATLAVGAAGTFAVTATGTPTPSLTETGSLPSGVTFADNGNGTATLSGTPAASSGGIYSLTIKAHNGAGADASQSFTLTVNQAPVITSASSATFTVGAVSAFTVTATGPPAPSLTVTGALPIGVSFVDNGNGTATLSGTPVTGTAGSYPFTITAHNGLGTDASQPFSLTVGTPAPLGFVQVNFAAPSTPQTKVAVNYTQAQTAGNLNVVVVGWNDSKAQINTVTDSNGNGYVLVVGPTVQTGTATQAIYYAKNIAGAMANANAVTVTFNTGAAYPDIRIAEYSGIDPTTPVDVAAAAQGSGASSNSGVVTTGECERFAGGCESGATTHDSAGDGVHAPRDHDAGWQHIRRSDSQRRGEPECDRGGDGRSMDHANGRLPGCG